MTTVYKVLGQINPPANTQTTIYTTPTGNSTVISTVTICNQDSNPATFSLAVQGSGAALQSKHYVNFNTVVPSNTTTKLTLGITMGAADILSANANTSTMSFSVFGSEIY
jgi:hypothetical protein